MKKALEKLQVYLEDSMQWTEIKDGKEFKNVMTLWLKVKELKQEVL